MSHSRSHSAVGGQLCDAVGKPGEIGGQFRFPFDPVAGILENNVEPPGSANLDFQVEAPHVPFQKNRASTCRHERRRRSSVAHSGQQQLNGGQDLECRIVSAP